jgi:uncharacterized protein YdaU (DUF1376 family)
MQRPSMPLFWGDYLADTKHLATVQHGAYLLLIQHYWSNEGLPDNDHELARITGLPLHSWRQMRPTIAKFFHDGWRHKRIDRELRKYDERIARLKVSGHIGGTRAAISKSKGKNATPYSGRVAIAGDAIGTLKQPDKDITTNLSVAARARAGPAPENPANSNVDDNQRPKSVQKNPAQSSEELDKILQAKGWRQ